MYVVSLVFFGFAVRKYQDKYIPAAMAMMLWFLASAMLERPAALLVPWLGILGWVEKGIFAVMTVLLLMLCILRKQPLRLDWVPLSGTLLAAAIRIGWYVCFSRLPLTDIARMAVLNSWKDFLLQLILCAVAVWHIYWMGRPRFIR